MRRTREDRVAQLDLLAAEAVDATEAEAADAADAAAAPLHQSPVAFQRHRNLTQNFKILAVFF